MSKPKPPYVCGLWAVGHDILTDGSFGYHVHPVTEPDDRIEAVDYESAKRLVDCLDENAA